jgi:putative flippase GtrA
VRQFVRYAIVGATQNVTNLAAFALATVVGVPLVPAALLAAVAALALSFTLNRRWTFPGSDDRTARRVTRFVAVWLAFVVVAIPTLVLLVEVAHVPKLLAQALIILVGAPLSYVVQRNWTFQPTEGGMAQSESLPASAAPEPAPAPATPPLPGPPKPPGMAAGNRPSAR